jgi:hypothetical protein
MVAEIQSEGEQLAAWHANLDPVVHKDQILCKRYCKLGLQTPYSRHQQRRGSPCYKSQDEHGWRDGASSRPTLRKRC